MLIRLACLLAVAVALPLRAGAQRPPVTLEPGDTVRVVAPLVVPRRVEGRLVSYRPDTLTLHDAVTGRTHAFPLASIRSLAKNEGPDARRSALRGARFGTFLGAAVGLVVGPFVAQRRESSHFVGTVLVSGAGGALLGAAAGGGAGALFPRDRWQPIRVPSPPPAG